MMKKTKYLALLSVVFLAGCSQGGTIDDSSIEDSSIIDTSSEVEPEECDHNLHVDSQTKPTETNDGVIVYQCGLCGEKINVTIPKLDSTNYDVTPLTVSCDHGNGYRYSSSVYGTYDVTDDARTLHSGYGEECTYCHNQVGEFAFKDLNSSNCHGYPRLYKLSDYWENAWLLGGDNGTIITSRSVNKGVSWSNQVVASFMTGYSCANVDFFELPNHDIICSYRAIGTDDGTGDILTNRKYSRKLHFSISRDGGKSWEDGSDIVDNYDIAPDYNKTKVDAYNDMKKEGRLGFFEPYVDLINNVPTVVYADDFTTTLISTDKSPAGYAQSYRTQYLVTQTFDMETETWSKERTVVIDGTVKKSPTGSGLASRVSRDGMPVFDRMSDGTYVMVYEGTYRDSDYSFLTGQPALAESHPFEILMSYSKDGVSWSNPVEIYTPQHNSSKSSAPFICITDDDQLIISFQTDEDAVPTYVGDAYSVMKCIISKPGIAIENINKDSFYGVNNVNNTPIGGNSLWNGMMIDGDKLYCCSTGCHIRVSKIPVYSSRDDYEVHVDGTKHDITTSSSNFTCYTSNPSYNPTFNSNNIVLDNGSLAEQKLMINGYELDNDYQIDLTISSVSSRDVKTGIYLGASNPDNVQDKITALNVNFERDINSNSWSISCFYFNQVYITNLGSKNGINEEYDINVRVVLVGRTIKVCVNDYSTSLLTINVPTQYEVHGPIGIRNQGTSKATISNISITY